MNYPADAPEKMKLEAESHGYPFPYLYDKTQSVAHAYGAACTPDFFVFDGGQLILELRPATDFGKQLFLLHDDSPFFG